MTHQVVIAGAGPAGVATAVGLVRAGVPASSILCLDRARFPRAKPCGGGLTGHAAAAMDALGLALRVPHVPCLDGQVVYGTIRRSVQLPRPVCIVRREDFDADLVAQARELGVEVREGEGVAAFRARADGVTVTSTTGRELRCQVLVGADGAGSLVRRHLLASYRRAPTQPLRLSRLELPAPAGLAPVMVYDFSPFVGGLRGYVWLFPVPGGRVNVGIMHYPASELGGRALDLLLGETLRKHGVELPRAARGWPAWPYDPHAPVASARLLTVGDAAGIDALTGEGIAVGLDQGLIAGRAIASALATRDFAFRQYRRDLRQAVVGRELSLDRRLAALLYGTQDFRRWLGLVLFDRKMQDLYAARVSGSDVLADHRTVLIGILGRHLLFGRDRRRAIDAALD